MEAAPLKLFDTLPTDAKASAEARRRTDTERRVMAELEAERRADAKRRAADAKRRAADTKAKAGRRAKAKTDAKAEAKRRAEALAKLRPHADKLEALRVALDAHAAEARELAGASQLMRGPAGGKQEWYRQGFDYNLKQARLNVSAYAERAGEQARAATAAFEHLGDAADPDAARNEARAACKALNAKVIMNGVGDHDGAIDGADDDYPGAKDSYRLTKQLRKTIAGCGSLRVVRRYQAAARRVFK